MYLYLASLIQNAFHFYAQNSLEKNCASGIYWQGEISCVSWQEQIAKVSVKNIMDLFSSLIGILHMLVAEGNFLPSCKLQPVGESLGLSAESRVVRVLFWGFFFWSVPNVIHICQRIFFSVLSAGKFLTTQFLRLA